MATPQNEPATASEEPLRIQCSVPHCCRTRGRRKGEGPLRAGDEWICQDHWRLVSRDMKRLHSRAKRRLRLAVEECENLALADAILGDEVPDILERRRAAADRRFRKLQQARRFWHRCKQQAIERAFGID